MKQAERLNKTMTLSCHNLKKWLGNKVSDIYQFGKGYKLFLKLWDSSEPWREPISRNWPKLPQKPSTTHPEDHKVHSLELKHTWVMQQDNDLKHTSKSKWLKKPQTKQTNKKKSNTGRSCSKTLQCGWMKIIQKSGPNSSTCEVISDSLPLITNAWFQYVLPRVVQPVIRIRRERVGSQMDLITLITLSPLIN